MANKEKERKTPIKPETRREKFALYFYDLSKLTFAALVLGIMTSSNGEFSDYEIAKMAVGIIGTVSFAYFGHFIMELKN